VDSDAASPDDEAGDADASAAGPDTAPPIQRVRLVILDDHEMFTDAMSAWAASVDQTYDVAFDVVYAGKDVQRALRCCPHVDLVLLDIDLGPSAPDAARLVQAFTSAGCHVLLVSAVGDAATIRSALLAGALGYVPKRLGTDALVEAIRTAAAGETVVSAELAAVMVSGEQRPDLSERELQTLRYYAAGLTIDAVARRMHVSPHTVKEYLDRVRRKYAAAGRDARTKTELYAEAVRDGFVDPLS
jgi:DNA-binding NarL/FixJ family response regulator